MAERYGAAAARGGGGHGTVIKREGEGTHYASVSTETQHKAQPPALETRLPTPQKSAAAHP